jgi:hypothetical protein
MRWPMPRLTGIGRNLTVSEFSRRRFFAVASTAIVAAGIAGAARSSPVVDGTWSTNALWPVLKKTKLTMDASGAIRAAFVPEVLALANKPMAITGFILPIETTTHYQHFILSRYSPECPFCPSGGPSEVIEVFSSAPIAPTSAMVGMKGMFTVQNDMARGMFYRMDHAAMV